MGTVTKGFHARLANQPFVAFDFLKINSERQSARRSKKLKTKSGLLASLASNAWI